MKRILYSALLLLSLGTPIFAEITSGKDVVETNLGGLPASCGLKANEADDAKSVSDQAEKSGWQHVNFGDSEVKFLSALNARKPVTMMVAEHIEAYRDGKVTMIFVVSEGRYCLLQPMETKDFDATVDDAFGAGT